MAWKWQRRMQRTVVTSGQSCGRQKESLPNGTVEEVVCSGRDKLELSQDVIEDIGDFVDYRYEFQRQQWKGLWLQREERLNQIIMGSTEP